MLAHHWVIAVAAAHQYLGFGIQCQDLAGQLLAAYLAGLDTVEEMTKDEQISAFLRRVLIDEIVPQVPLPDPERRAYAATILERFGNPFIRHELLSISLNSVSKWVVRVLPTIKDWAAAGQSAPKGLAFSLAALLWFYRGQRQADGVYGRRESGSYPIRDDAHVLDGFVAAWAEAKPGEAAEVASKLMRDNTLWGEDLTKLAALENEVRAAIAAIESRGMRAALAERLSR